MSDPVTAIQPAAEEASDKAYEIVAELIDTRCEDVAFLTAETLRSFSDAVVAAVWPLAVTQTRADVLAVIEAERIPQNEWFGTANYCHGYDTAISDVLKAVAERVMP